MPFQVVDTRVMLIKQSGNHDALRGEASNKGWADGGENTTRLATAGKTYLLIKYYLNSDSGRIRGTSPLHNTILEEKT